MTRGWKSFWIVFAILVSPLAIHFISTVISYALGCVNFIELGCEPGVGRSAAGLALIFGLLGFVTVPFALLLVAIGLGLYLYRRFASNQA